MKLIALESCCKDNQLPLYLKAHSLQFRKIAKFAYLYAVNPIVNTNILEEEKEHLRQAILGAGACAVGFAEAAPVSPEAWEDFCRWLDAGHNAGMEYMHNYPDLRRDPRLLLEGCRTVISIAFSYAQPRYRDPAKGMIASYAYGRDYHKELRKILRPIIKTHIQDKFGPSSTNLSAKKISPPIPSADKSAPAASARICIDSAPILERYWAEQAGIGRRGDNGAIIIPGHGSLVFLAEILTTIPFPPDASASIGPVGSVAPAAPVAQVAPQKCSHCGACRRACPGSAILPDGTIDARRCLSYLTIEHRGSFPRPLISKAEAASFPEKPGGHPEAGSVALRLGAEKALPVIFGCDICLRSCPLNKAIPTTPIPAFLPSPEIMELTPEAIREMDESRLGSLLAGSPISRCGIEGLRRNISL